MTIDDLISTINDKLLEYCKSLNYYIVIRDGSDDIIKTVSIVDNYSTIALHIKKSNKMPPNYLEDQRYSSLLNLYFYDYLEDQRYSSLLDLYFYDSYLVISNRNKGYYVEERINYDDLDIKKLLEIVEAKV